MEPSGEETTEEPARRGAWAPGRPRSQRGQEARQPGKRPQGRACQKPQEDLGSPAQRPAAETRTAENLTRHQKVSATITSIRTRFGTGSIGLGYGGIRYIPEKRQPPTTHPRNAGQDAYFVLGNAR